MSDEEEEPSGPIGVSKYPCMPSLVALQQMRNRLHLAYLGKKLMKWSALATGKELRHISKDMNLCYDHFKERVADACLALARCRYFYPNLNKMVLEDIQKHAHLIAETNTKIVAAGVKCLSFEVHDTGYPSYPHLGIDKGGQTIKETKQLWEDLLKKLILILELRQSFTVVEFSHSSATKKKNVLSKVIIPRILMTINYILSELEEREREETFRLKVFKKSKEKKKKKDVNEEVPAPCLVCEQKAPAPSTSSEPPVRVTPSPYHYECINHSDEELKKDSCPKPCPGKNTPSKEKLPQSEDLKKGSCLKLCPGIKTPPKKEKSSSVELKKDSCSKLCPGIKTPPKKEMSSSVELKKDSCSKICSGKSTPPKKESPPKPVCECDNCNKCRTGKPCTSSSSTTMAKTKTPVKSASLTSRKPCLPPCATAKSCPACMSGRPCKAVCQSASTETIKDKAIVTCSTATQTSQPKSRNAETQCDSCSRHAAEDSKPKPKYPKHKCFDSHNFQEPSLQTMSDSCICDFHESNEEQPVSQSSCCNLQGFSSEETSLESDLEVTHSHIEKIAQNMDDYYSEKLVIVRKHTEYDGTMSTETKEVTITKSQQPNTHSTSTIKASRSKSPKSSSCNKHDFTKDVMTDTAKLNKNKKRTIKGNGFSKNNNCSLCTVKQSIERFKDITKQKCCKTRSGSLNESDSVCICIASQEKTPNNSMRHTLSSCGQRKNCEFCSIVPKIRSYTSENIFDKEKTNSLKSTPFLLAQQENKSCKKHHCIQICLDENAGGPLRNDNNNESKSLLVTATDILDSTSTHAYDAHAELLNEVEINDIQYISSVLTPSHSAFSITTLKNDIFSYFHMNTTEVQKNIEDTQFVQENQFETPCTVDSDDLYENQVDVIRTEQEISKKLSIEPNEIGGAQKESSDSTLNNNSSDETYKNIDN